MSDPVEVQRVRRQGGRGATLLVAVFVAAVAGLAGWGLFGSPAGGAPSPAPGVSAAVRSAFAPVPVLEVRDGMDAMAALLRWPACDRWSGLGWGTAVDGAAVRRSLSDAALDPAGPDARVAGLLDVRDRSGRAARVFLGQDAAVAAAALGGTSLVLDADGVAWTDLPGPGGRVAARLDRVRDSPPGDQVAGVEALSWWYVADRTGLMPWCGDPDRPGADIAGRTTIAPLIFVGDADGAEIIAFASDWLACSVWTRYRAGAPRPSGARVDAIAFETGMDEGWIDLGDGRRAWLGPDVQSLGGAVGARMVALGRPARDDPWTLLRIDGAPVALQWARVETPAGRVAWVATGNASGPSCWSPVPSPAPVPPTPAPGAP